jgi:hypothetical protein
LLPIEPEKEEGPATAISLLGIELDTDKIEVRLPPGKLAQLKASLEKWRGRNACKKRELLWLIGSLSRPIPSEKAHRHVDHSEAAQPVHG